ncbi:MAG: HopJ type III effector protein [Methylovulum sp.]|jgi:hypothetical protein|nr:HopJ type III effector protein [Methylovulum sp.]MCF7998259.1 HopJ type III effector protein [Methylovulum sp.]
MSLTIFLNQVTNNKPVSFDETIAMINDHYHYQPTDFKNGLTEPVLYNKAGTNEGSCRIFAFAQWHGLNEEQTLNLFGDFYRQDVLADPNGSSHPNIRNFLRDGWKGIIFDGVVLTPKSLV